MNHKYSKSLKMKYIPVPEAWYKDFLKIKKICEHNLRFRTSDSVILCMILGDLNWEKIEKNYKKVIKQ